MKILKLTAMLFFPVLSLLADELTICGNSFSFAGNTYTEGKLLSMPHKERIELLLEMSKNSENKEKLIEIKRMFTKKSATVSAQKVSVSKSDSAMKAPSVSGSASSEVLAPETMEPTK